MSIGAISSSLSGNPSISSNLEFDFSNLESDLDNEINDIAASTSGSSSDPFDSIASSLGISNSSSSSNSGISSTGTNTNTIA